MNISRARRWMLILSTVVVLIWTLLMWGFYGLLSLTDEGLAKLLPHVGASAEVATWAHWLSAFAQDFGNVIVLMLWAVGVVGVMVVAGSAAWALPRLRAWREEAQYAAWPR